MHECVTTSTYSTRANPDVLVVTHEYIILHTAQLFFGNGQKFCLKGGNEYRDLKLSQLKRTEWYILHECIVRSFNQNVDNTAGVYIP